jgi:hypothetical protein
MVKLLVLSLWQKEWTISKSWTNKSMTMAQILLEAIMAQILLEAIMALTITALVFVKMTG